MTNGSGQADVPGEGGHREQREEKRLASTEMPIPETQLSGTVQAEPSLPAPVEQPSRSALYSDRLKLIWAAAHSRAEEKEGEWVVFQEAMVRVGDFVALVGDEAELTSESRESLEGDLDTVALFVADKVASQPGAPTLAAYVRNTLTPTIARLEQVGEGTPERRVDVIVRVLVALRGAPAVGDLACELFRYLQDQDPAERQAGFYMTVANLATLVSAVGGDFRRVDQAFMCHVALDGMRSVALQGNLPALQEANAGSVSTVAFNVAVDVATLLRRREELSSPQGVGVLRDLMAISASTTPLVDIQKVDPGEVVRALGFETNQPTEFLTVLADIGGIAEAWQQTPIGRARLQASSGVADAVMATGRQASRLFNAGISLLRAQADDPRALSAGRLLLNTLGLRLALLTGRDLVAALVHLDGLDCAINLVGAFVEYQRVADAAVSREVEPLIRQLIDLGRWPSLRALGPGVGIDLARLTSAAERLKMSPQERASFPELLSSLESALDALRAATPRAPRALHEPLLDTAQLVGHIFRTVLPPTADSSGLQQVIDGVVASRGRAVDVLEERYARYASSPDDQVGDGPLVAADVLQRSEWDHVAGRLLHPLHSIVPALRDFALP
ncbi:MAG: hypothetical protein ACRDYA_10105 [Egibacteraceae bacterium]